MCPKFQWKPAKSGNFQALSHMVQKCADFSEPTGEAEKKHKRCGIPGRLFFLFIGV